MIGWMIGVMAVLGLILLQRAGLIVDLNYAKTMSTVSTAAINIFVAEAALAFYLISRSYSGQPR